MKSEMVQWIDYKQLNKKKRLLDLYSLARLALMRAVRYEPVGLFGLTIVNEIDVQYKE